MEGTSTSLELRLIVYNGHFVVVSSTPNLTYKRFRSFSVEKTKKYSRLISETYTGAEEVPVIEGGKDDALKIAHVLKHAKATDIHCTTTIANPMWRRVFFWELEFEGIARPALDEPFRELLGMLEGLNDKIESGESHFDHIALPKIDGITCNVSILKLSRLFWAAKHLRFQAPLLWEDELRVALMQAINTIDISNLASKTPAFRAVDFWYIWGAFRGLDDDLVEAMVAKLADAKTHGTDPKDLEFLNTEIKELNTWLTRVEQKKPKTAWVQHTVGGMGGRRANTPAPLMLSSSFGAMSNASKTATYIPPLGRNAPKHQDIAAPLNTAYTPPRRVMLRESAAIELSASTRAEDEKGEAGTSTTPTAMASPTRATKGTMRNGKKKNHSLDGK
ncbi:uncharacterized protein PV09_02485 [Verruconis gallopava]|uniref:Uncharacterized protein n=1 Tax=Verruconis gallopava TaxID=253628 RepID=A0A0D2AJQ4_9PEZI|nr:uncharacterized protein PV09_02485 [Verruconis gallopava]KIW06805.1 hypothetical protein PV09_02485 [Verruconis gallopava]